MTYNEIIKALECCSNDDDGSGCGDCPLGDKYPYCDDVLDGQIIDLIHRKNAEIERLTDSLNATIAGQETLQRYIAIAKANAIKEFAERLKEESWQGRWEIIAHVDVDEIDNLVKEMVGDEDG